MVNTGSGPDLPDSDELTSYELHLPLTLFLFALLFSFAMDVGRLRL